MVGNGIVVGVAGSRVLAEGWVAFFSEAAVLTIGVLVGVKILQASETMISAEIVANKGKYCLFL